MPIKTYYLLDSTASGSSGGSLQDGGAAPTAALTTTGWTVGKTAANNYSPQVYGTTQAAGTFGATDNLNTASAPLATNFWRSQNPLIGNFAAGTWAFTFNFRTGTGSQTTTSGSQVGRLNIKLFKSPNANGTANATVVELSGGAKLTGSNTAAMSSNTTDYFSNVTWSAPAINLYNEYLFISAQWETITAGSGNSNQVVFRVGSQANVVTTNFTSKNRAATIT